MSLIERIGEILGDQRYLAHSICLTNDPLIMTVFAASNLATWVAYFTIGITLFVKRAKVFKLRPGSTVLYGLFIFLCGLNHLTETITLFWGVYFLDVGVKMAMAGVSVVTAVYTVSDLIPDDA
jgi:hypothetical protein